jgi:HTH-type transcriptional regulator/antitoxin HipB
MRKATTAKELSHHLREIRTSQDLSQSHIAKKVGLRQDTVSAFELHSESTKLATLFKILSALNLEIHIVPRNTHPTEWQEEW